MKGEMAVNLRSNLTAIPIAIGTQGRKGYAKNFLANHSAIAPLRLRIRKNKYHNMAQAFTDSNFQTEVLSSDKLSVVDFWAEWCGPCRAIGPVIEELATEYTGKVNIGKVNVDENPQVSMNYGITSIPAILFIKNGEVVDKLVGVQPKGNFVKKIQSHM